MRKTILLTLSLLPIISYANTGGMFDEFQSMLDDATEIAGVKSSNELESLLDEVSDIATKKSINVDYLPSVVTVIKAQTFRDAGIQNIGEALNMLPGIQMQINRMGHTTTTVRGLKNPNAYRSDKIKVLIDGVAMNNEAQGSASFYMDFPLQIVEKIEVLRGPGSTVYGAGAFYATINIITKVGNSKKNGQVFLGTGSYKNKTIGTNLHEKIGNWEIYADAYHKKNDKHIDLPTGFSSNGTKTDEAMEDTSFGFKLTNGSWEFLTRYKENTYGNFYGYEEDLDPLGNQEKAHTNSYLSTQLSYKTSLNDYKLEAKVNFSKRTLDAEASFYDVAWVASNFIKGGVDMQEGFWYGEHSEEQNIEAEAILSLPKIASNDISFGAGAKRARMTKDDFFSSVENAITENYAAISAIPDANKFRWRPSKEPAFWNNPTTSLYKDGLTRYNAYGYAQDLISVSDSIDIVLGLRMDEYSDLDAQLSKRAAIVYRADDKSVFKALYGSAFRAPTFTENYHNGHINFRSGGEDIKPEKTDTYELQALYSPNFNNKLSINIFYSDLKDVIDLEEDDTTASGYKNYDDRRSQGVEFEYYLRTKLTHNFYFNASYVETLYRLPTDGFTQEKDIEMPDISKVMLKALHIYTPISELSFGTTFRYESQTSPNGIYDPALDNWPYHDGTIEAQYVFDETVTYRLSSASKLRLTVKNLLDAEIKNPSYYYNHEGGILREGRNFFLSYIQNF